MAEVRQALAAYRFRFQNEAELQAAIAEALMLELIPYEREVRFNRHDRIDFLVASEIGLEVKIDGRASEVLRQLARYAALPNISALVLVTSKPTLAPSLENGTLLCGKPFHAYVLPRVLA